MTHVSDIDEINLTEVLPIMPLRNTVVFPHQVIPLAVGREKSLNLLKYIVYAVFMYYQKKLVKNNNNNIEKKNIFFEKLGKIKNYIYLTNKNNWKTNIFLLFI